MKKLIATVFLTSLVFGALAFAQQVVNQGKPGTQGPWPVVGAGGTITIITDGGYLGTVGPVRCATITNSNTVVGAASTVVPAAPQANRIYITVCNSTQNSATSQVKCRGDNVAPVFAAGNPGDFLETGDCMQYAVGPLQPIRCIANGAGINVLGYECTPP